jgi:predicted membrane protein
MVIYIILFIAAILAILLFSVALRVRLIVNSEKPEINLTLLWLDPFLNALVTIENKAPVLRIFLFNRLIITREIKKLKKKTGRMEFKQLKNLKDIHVDILYGFSDPFITGTVFGMISMVSQFINKDSVIQNPDFLSENDYIYLDGTAKVNIGTTLINLYKPKASS